jgi:hypothetical protein
MLGTTFDERVAEKNKARIERYLPLVLDTIATCAHALPLQIFFLFVHRAMPVCTAPPSPFCPPTTTIAFAVTTLECRRWNY